MQIGREKDGFLLVLFTPERVFLERILSVILANYSSPPEKLHPRGVEVWYPPGLEKGDVESPEDREFWTEQQQGFRSENATLCRGWIESLQGTPAQEPMVIRLPSEQSEIFMQVLNDHRIYLAAVHGITEHDMGVDWHKVKDEVKAQALLEIHFLAAIIEGMLQS